MFINLSFGQKMAIFNSYCFGIGMALLVYFSAIKKFKILT